jgi:hypothetical protein
LGIASDDEYERSATEDVGQSATEAPVPTGAEGAGGDIQALQAQGAPIVGDGGAETEGFVEMLASAAALDATDGPAVPAAPAPFSAPTSSATAGDLDQTATNAVLAVAGNLGAPAKAAVRNAEAIELTTAEGAAGSDAAGDPAGLGAAERNGAAASNPAIARASVPSVPGRGGSDRSILVNPNAAVQADEGGGMGIAEKLAAAKLPNAGAERAAMPAIRGGAGEMPIRPAEAPTSFNQTLTEIALSNGFVHRSGDLVGALDRMTAGHGVQPGAAALRPTPVQILPIEIGMQALRGATQFQIRLDPAELGRVEVTLEIKEDGEVKASLVVDRVETLALLKREAPHLQQAFEQAGLRQNADGLSFSLRGDGQQHSQREESAERSHTPLQDDENLRLQREIGEIAMRRVLIPNASLDRVV